MKLKMLSFEGDKILDDEIKRSSNYCDNSHIYTLTFGICALVLSEISPIDLDGCSRLTLRANVKQQVTGGYGYHRDAYFKISYYNLDEKTSRELYQFTSTGTELWAYITDVLLNVLSEIDAKNGGKNDLSNRRHEIAENLRKCRFYKETLLQKFSKTNGKYKASVYKCLGSDIGEVIKVSIINRRTDEPIISENVTVIPGTIQIAELISKTFWEENRFYIIFGKRDPKLIKYIEIPNPN